MYVCLYVSSIWYLVSMYLSMYLSFYLAILYNYYDKVILHYFSSNGLNESCPHTHTHVIVNVMPGPGVFDLVQ